jgi:hypothetical protein
MTQLEVKFQSELNLARSPLDNVLSSIRKEIMPRLRFFTAVLMLSAGALICAAADSNAIGGSSRSSLASDRPDNFP